MHVCNEFRFDPGSPLRGLGRIKCMQRYPRKQRGCFHVPNLWHPGHNGATLLLRQGPPSQPKAMMVWIFRIQLIIFKGKYFRSGPNTESNLNLRGCKKQAPKVKFDSYAFDEGKFTLAFSPIFLCNNLCKLIQFSFYDWTSRYAIWTAPCGLFQLLPVSPSANLQRAASLLPQPSLCNMDTLYNLTHARVRNKRHCHEKSNRSKFIRFNAWSSMSNHQNERIG